MASFSKTHTIEIVGVVAIFPQVDKHGLHLKFIRKKNVMRRRVKCCTLLRIHF